MGFSALLPTIVIVLANIHLAFAILQATSLPQAFPALADLNTPLPNKVGGQNFTYCCLKAVDEFYEIQNGDVVYSPNPAQILIQRSDPSQFAQEQWPCGAAYNGSNAGAPEVQITYQWCNSNCPGWQQSTNKALTQWVQPFVGFILPAAVFCLNVPRKRVLAIRSLDWFPNHLSDLRDRLDDTARQIFRLWNTKKGPKPNVSPAVIAGASATVSEKDGAVQAGKPQLAESHTTEPPKDNSIKVFDVFGSIILLFFFAIYVVVEMVLRGATAASIALADTVIWIAIVFSTAAPMMLSGLYETNVDRQILKAVSKSRRYHNEANSPTSTMPASAKLAILKREVHLLYALLVGNLVLPEHPGGFHITDSEDGDKTTGKKPQEIGMVDPPAENAIARAWNDVCLLVSRLDNPEAWVVEGEATRSRLQTMLECQASFGGTIGAPVVFFLGSFLLSVFSNLQAEGDNDTSHALAFGEWWMTIPHVAVVSGCLLAGNNPNTLEAIMSGLTSRHKGRTQTAPANTGDRMPNLERRPTEPVATDPAMPGWFNSIKTFMALKLYAAYYEGSDYQPVWMFDRGRNKRRWVASVQELYLGKGEEKPPNALRAVEAKYKRWWDQLVWRYNAEATDVNQLSLPSVLPDTDLADWLYLLLSVVVLMLIPFILAYLTSYYTPTIGLGCRSFTFVLYFIFQLWLAALWLWDFRYEKHERFMRSRELGGRTYVLPTWFGVATALGFIGSAFTAIVGTFMQLLGVFRNCLCLVPLTSWGRGRDGFYVTISSNSAESIAYAGQYWISTGIASIVLLIVVCFAGWWYQRHWRGKFKDVIKEVMSTTLGGDASHGTTNTGH